MSSAMIYKTPKDRRVLDEEFKMRVEASIERLLFVVEGNEKHPGLVDEMKRLTRMTEGGIIAVKLLLFLGGVAGGLAAAFAWIHDKVAFK